MWPADVLELLTALADLQKYDELWGFVMRYVSTHLSTRHTNTFPEFASLNVLVLRFCILDLQATSSKLHDAVESLTLALLISCC
jgi:hypothetical protein